ncbi:MAG: cation diffusion facilitator family transporter [Anaerolineae bacterium]|nr:cation diffusion facilitator family transporter [Anaerolineae bacterium]
MITSGRHAQVQSVLRITLILNVVVALGKIVTGIVTGAIAISADGVHSLIDAASNVLALVANRVAAQPPDADHPYGHRRFETVAALVLGLLLLLTAWEIVGGALDRLMGGEAPTLTPAAFIVMIGTLAVNLFVSRYERRKGEALASELLLADAANTGADVWVTTSVLVSMGLVAAGVGWADAAAALVVVVLIGRAGIEVIRRAGGVLVDTAPYTPERLIEIVQRVPSVGGVLRARSRGSADAAIIDLDLEVAPAMTADHTAAIAEAVRGALKDALGSLSEVAVRFVPAAPVQAAPNYPLIVRAQADALGLATHEVQVTDLEGARALALHVEVPAAQTLSEAHAQVSTLEANLRAALPEIDSIVTHIEPAGAGEINGALAAGCARIEASARALLDERYPSMVWHDVHAVPLDGGYGLTLHVAMPGSLTLERAHAVAEGAELLLRSELPRLARVTIHTEPPEE